ncbi:MAG: sigma 54-interacting transcriptional regulator [Desulfomonilaceae bacterium]
MRDNRLQVLLIEDNPGDVRLIREMLAETRSADIGIESVESLSAGLDLLTTGGFDVVLLDLGLPDSQGLATLGRLYARVSDIPIVVFTGQGDEAVALEAVKQGAQDYLVKGEVDEKLLTRSIHYAVERRRLLAELEVSRASFTSIVEKSADGIFVLGNDGSVLYANSAASELMGKSEETLLGTPFPLPAVPGERTEVEVVHPKGSEGIAEMRVRATDWNGCPASLAILRDVTMRKQAEEALRQSEERFRAVFEGAQDCIFIKDRQLKYTMVNPAKEKLLNRRASEIVGHTSEAIFGKEIGGHIREVDLRVLDGQTIEEERVRPINGVPLTFHDIRAPLRDSSGEIVGVCGISRDITDRKTVELPTSQAAGEYPSKAMKSIMRRVNFAAETESTVLLLGESGSGKDYLARYIHDRSKRADGPYWAINCAAVSGTLADSELFGHERGAFTGAQSRKRGLLELAEGGTLLLNEIGELSLPLQAKLLTFLDTRQFTRVGGEKNITVNARLVAATNRDLEKEVEAGRFRQDLFYRLNVLSVVVPPLRERREDLPILIREMMTLLCKDMQVPGVPAIDAATVNSLKSYDWPGNVRELRNVLERALILSGGQCIKLAGLGVDTNNGNAKDWSLTVCFPTEESLNDITHHVKRSLVNEALRRSGGSRQGAARLLGISRYSLKHYMKSLGLEWD